MNRTPSRRLAAMLATLLLAAGCETVSDEDTCKRYAAQAEALKKIEAEETLATLGGTVKPEDLWASPANIARATREIEPRCMALSKEKRACVASLVPVLDSFLEARAACDDQPCRNAAGETAKDKLDEDCLEVTRGLDCVRSEDCKPAPAG